MLRRIALIAALSAMAWSGVAHALGLGDIQLRSALNEPLDAEIELMSVTPEELRSLEVFLAPPATFERYGLDRPQFLTRIRFEVVRTANGGVVRLTSPNAITEPFVTVLVEANWSRGRLLREYTVLLDPPIFANRAAPAPAPQPSASQGGTRRSSQPIRRPAGGGQPVGTFDGDRYVVQRNDTLWEIAERVRPASDLSTNQVMLALFEANPAAFGGNINLISAGATLRVPSADAMRNRNRGSALAEVRRQNSEWRGAPSKSGNGTLILTAPDDDLVASDPRSGGATGTATGTSSGSGSTSDLAAELAERDRLLAIRDREIAELRARLAAAGDTDAAAIIDQPQDTDDDVAVASPGVELPDPGDNVFVDNTDLPDATDIDSGAPVDGTDTATADADTTPATATDAPNDQPSAPPIAAPPAKVSLMDRITGLAGSMWTWVGLGVVALLLLLPILGRLRGGSDDDSTGTWEALDDFEDDDSDPAATSRLRALASEDDESIVVVESEKGRTTASLDESLAPKNQAREPAGDTYSIEDTFSSETAINLDQSDPIAEADFHMAYGLYDQAADLITGAIATDPGRRDLKEKLAEVYFVWGNQDGFVGAAEQLREQIGEESDEGWDKIRIMGQQIAPTHALFSEGAPASPLESVDLDFADAGASERMDIDFAVEDEGSAELASDSGAAGDDADALDFEFSATGAHDASVMDLDTGDLFDASDDGPTVERDGRDDDESPTVERLVGDDSPTVERPSADEITQETPTIESVALGGEENTAEMPIVADESTSRADETAEIDLDDLGLDLEGLEDSAERSAIINMSDMDELDIDSSIETLGISQEDLDGLGEDDLTKAQPASGESVTVLAPGAASNDAGESSQETLLAPVDLDDSLIASANDDETVLAHDSSFQSADGGTGRVPVISGDDVDLDLDDLTAALQKTDFGNLEDAGDATIERPLEGGHKSDLENDVMADSLAGDDALDLDIGVDLDDEDDAPTATRAETLEGEPDNRTMTEVGTKLDLARAYIDMGDPDGARSILKEVADEGSSAQQQEARKLLEDLAN